MTLGGSKGLSPMKILRSLSSAIVFTEPVFLFSLWFLEFIQFSCFGGGFDIFLSSLRVY